MSLWIPLTGKKKFGRQFAHGEDPGGNLMSKKFLLLSIGLFITACAEKPAEPTPDNWQTPTLSFKKKESNSSQIVQVTPSFKSDLDGDDQFEFNFKGSNKELQKSIVSLRVRAKCAANSEMNEGVFEDEFLLGARALFQARELVPAANILDNTKEMYCSWELTIFNVHNSSRVYSLPPLKLTRSTLTADVQILDSEKKEVTAGTLLDLTTIQKVTIGVPIVGEYQPSLVCDLITISSEQTIHLSEIILNKSSDENLRFAHPVQKCFVEIKTDDNRILRSIGYRVHLSPKPLYSVEIDYSNPQELIALDDRMYVGHVLIKNQSSQNRTFVLFGAKPVPYDILFFSDQGTGGTDLPNNNIFWYLRKTGGELIAESPTNLKFEDKEKKRIVVGPNEQIEFSLMLNYHLVPGCSIGGTYAIGGLRLPFSQEILTEDTSYKDKKGNLENPNYGSANLTLRPMPNFIKLIHNKLFYPSVYERQYHPVASGC